MGHRRALVTGLTAILLAAACGSVTDADSGDAARPQSTGPQSTGPGQEAGTTESSAARGPALKLRFGSVTERNIDPQADGRHATAAVAGVNQFAVDIFRAAAQAKPDANLVLSPYSIANALGMIYGGARGVTATEMAAVLHADGLADDWHVGLNAYDLSLDARTAGTPTEWVTANKVWLQQGFAVRDEYLDLLTGRYGSALAEADFSGATEAERATINEWVSENTKQRIPELFPQGAIASNTVLALVNAVALDAPWEFPFDPAATHDADFVRPDGTVVTVPTMSYGEYLPTLWTEELQAVELPYSGGTMSMVILMPRDLPRFVETMTAESLAATIDQIADGGIHLTMPKWTARTHYQLNDMLSALGMPSAFGAADFSGIAPDLHLSTVEHEAFIEVDEVGTRAAAATGGAMEASHGPTITIDHPFLYVIRDTGAGTTLFIGQVTDPS